MNLLWHLVSSDLSLDIMDYGATIVSLKYLGEEMILSYPFLEDYMIGKDYVGATVGRYANRISNASFPLNGKNISLDPNEGSAHLHGGTSAMDKKIWTCVEKTESSITLSYFSPHMENGYPGNCQCMTKISLQENTLLIEWMGQSDQDTIYGPTSHLYFHLGEKENAIGTLLQIKAEQCCQVDGKPFSASLQPCMGKYNFNEMRSIKNDYDTAFLMKDGRCIAENKKVRLEIKTDYPAMQLYSGQGLSYPSKPYAAFALEPEFLPDSPNHPEWESPILRKNKPFHKQASYTFMTKDKQNYVNEKV